MGTLDLSRLPADAGSVFRPFAEEALRRFPDRIHALCVIGSCLTGDFVSSVSDINSVFVMASTDVDDLDVLAGIRAAHAKKRISPPLVMTVEYIERSLDAFPVEFLDMKLFHATIAGTDPFSGLAVDRGALRLQCERDLKAKLVNLSRGYLSCAGSTRDLSALLQEALPGYFPLLRAMLFLVRAEEGIPGPKKEVLRAVEEAFGLSLDTLRELMEIRVAGFRLRDWSRLKTLFQELHGITHDLSTTIDRMCTRE
ncbi:MAG TPA: hypothetical protein PLS81_06680 [Deltaproteobacteria bacterium]|nr:hypothetical protein [Deltaproteobacteria bacterium]HOM29126.1 hypothetical protein [Deltaproteobacteria bacterium]HPP79800.1 hypothetical protein [Deltaproteobacteria bacterium]